MKYSLLSCCIVSAAILTSCASGSKIRAQHTANCSDKLHEAIVKFDTKHFASAQYLLTDISAKCPGGTNGDTILLYLGKSWLGMKKPDEAKTEFNRLMQSFPNSPLIEEAKYLAGYSAYRTANPETLDQTSTKEALQTLQNFVDRFPLSPFADSAKFYMRKCADKLIHKEFQTARFYETITQFESAVVYYRYIIDEYPNCTLIFQVKLLMAQDLLKLNRNEEANALLDDLLANCSDAAILKDARMLRVQDAH